MNIQNEDQSAYANQYWGDGSHDMSGEGDLGQHPSSFMRGPMAGHDRRPMRFGSGRSPPHGMEHDMSHIGTDKSQIASKYQL